MSSCVAVDEMKSNETKSGIKSTVSFNSFSVINNFMELLIINGKRLFSVWHNTFGVLVAAAVTFATNNIYFVYLSWLRYASYLMK